MKTFFLIASFLILVLWVTAQSSTINKEEPTETGIQFHTESWQKVLDLAKKENKVIFLDIYASWCGPCKLLKSKTFSDPEVGEFYNANFINVALDGEKGEGVELAQKYQLTAYPTLIFIYPDGSVKLKAMGYHNAKQFLELGQSVINK